jgi:O-acetyl-ADP-ribose deacetylase (regulator of RNase III)
MNVEPSYHTMTSRVRVIKGDITLQRVDAIVNAANNSLLGGGGVDGAIHWAAGPGLLEECRQLNGCETGEAKITGGHNLRAHYVIHTVGPIWRGGNDNEDELLASCYQHSLALAVQHDVRTIAFPSISTGAYGFPVERASLIAVGEIASFLRQNSTIQQVIIVCFNDQAYECYSSAVEKIMNDK